MQRPSVGERWLLYNELIPQRAIFRSDRQAGAFGGIRDVDGRDAGAARVEGEGGDRVCVQPAKR